MEKKYPTSIIKSCFTALALIVSPFVVDAQNNTKEIEENLLVYDIGMSLYELGKSTQTEGIDTVYWANCDWDSSFIKFFDIRTPEKKLRDTYKSLSDLNKHLNVLGYEEVKDCIWSVQNNDSYYFLVVKGTSPEYFEIDEYDSTITHNRNPRGIVYVKKEGKTYNVLTQNLDFLDSGEEYGGVYFAPELNIEFSSNGNLRIDYYHGRYGMYGKEFVFNGSDFVLTSYYNDESASYITESLSNLRIDFKEKIITYSHIINLDEYMENDEIETKYHTFVIPFSTNVFFSVSNLPRYK